MPPCGGHLPPAEPPPYQCRFQVVPPCGGHPGQLGIATDNVLVSSRAPVWGASDCFCLCSAFFSVSSRAPVWGASTASKVRVFVAVSFKSCPRVGGISTNLTEFRLHRCFKSCPRVGGIPCGSSFSFIVMFQVVPPCGGHPLQRTPGWGRTKCFKSCPRVGGIARLVGRTGAVRVSSRAPVWGASFESVCLIIDAEVSSRAPVWGASGTVATAVWTQVFQVVPPCGGHQALEYYLGQF